MGRQRRARRDHDGRGRRDLGLVRHRVQGLPRILEGGEITHRIALDRDCFACMLGGPDRRTLFMMTAEWLGPDKVDEALARKTGRVLAVQVDVPGVGWP